jgi:ABC-2 type transport system ATP-binding protein
MIEIDGLTKRYGDKTAVDQLSFVLEPGVVTGFLGPNGAGKSTTMRMIAGLDQPEWTKLRGLVYARLYRTQFAPQAALRSQPSQGLTLPLGPLVAWAGDAEEAPSW